MFEICWQIGDNYGHDVKNDEVGASEAAKDVFKFIFNVQSKEIKGKHVEKQMHVIVVNESGCQKTVIFTPCINEVGIHDHPADGRRVVKRKKADQNGKSNNEICDRQG
jgi:hypothetical protein